MNNEIEQIKTILINIWEEECAFNEGSFDYSDFVSICKILDNILEYIEQLEKKIKN